jgi:phage shock protein PspC (stress-responsive transcriptional regulator)
MNKTININLAGIIFHVDEDAYQQFNEYLNAVRNQFNNADEREEIIGDIESRIAELLQEKLSDSKQVINRTDIDEVISRMGSPEDYAVDDQDGAGTESTSSNESFQYAGPKRLFRNPDDKILGGVSGGLAAYFGIDPIWIRLIWVALFFGWGTGILIYIILWIVMPEAKTTTQKLQMRGKPINISNIERTVKEEMKDVKDRFNNYRESNGYKRTGNRIRNTLEEIITAILTVLRYILEFAFKLIGVLLMIAGVIILITLFSLLVGGDFRLNGVLIDWGNISGYLEALMPSATQSTLLGVGVVLLALAPIIGLILLSVRILFNYRSQWRYTGGSLVVLSIVGTIFIFAALTRLGVDFKGDARYNQTIELGGEYENYALRVGQFIDDERPYELDWTITDEAQLINFVELDVRKTDNDAPYIELEMNSKGNSRLEARNRAKNYVYYTEQQDSIILLADYFSLPLDEKYRLQQLDVTLYLPVGYSVYLDESTIDIIHDIKNVTNTFDPDMVDHTWIMTQNGLACADCDGTKDEWRSDDEWNDFDDEFEDEAREYEDKMDDELREAERKLKEAEKEIEKLEREKKRAKKNT